MNPEAPLLCMHGLAKRYPGVVALDNVDFSVNAGEVHALVGENGAGKSTLIKIAAGLVHADAGEVLLRGQVAEITSPARARSLGIALVHQEPDIYPDLTVVENLFLGRGMPMNKLGWIDWPAARGKAQAVFAELGEQIDVMRPGRTLGAAQRQIVDIAAALAQDVRVLFLDEPTASLSRKESEMLFANIRKLRARGVGIVYVSHRLEEVLALADRVTVLRDGKNVWTRRAAEVDSGTLVNAMVGRDVSAIFPRLERTPGETLLQVRNLSTADGACRDVSFSIRAGEIVGMYGLVGAGRSEAAQALAGLAPYTGDVQVAGQPVDVSTPVAALRAGIAYVPEDRLSQGLFLDQSIAANITIGTLPKFATAGVVRRGHEAAAVCHIVAGLQIKAHDPGEAVGTLSGGNQQKVVLGRWLSAAPEVLLLDEPTRGVDVGAKAEIHNLIQQVAAQGKAVLLISSDCRKFVVALTVSWSSGKAKLSPRLTPESPARPRSLLRRFHRAPLRINFKSVLKLRRLPLWLRALARREMGLAGIVGLLCTVLALTTEAFLTWRNFTDILHNISSLAIAATGMTLVICAGSIDISIGAMLGLCGVASAQAVMHGVPAYLAVLLGIGLGAGLGVLNATVSVLGRIHSIIVTLGAMSIYRSLLILLTGGSWVLDLPENFLWYAQIELFAVPLPVWAMLVVAGSGMVFQSRIHAGRCLYAVGGNPRAARTAGLSPARMQFLAFGALGAAVGLAAVLDAARFGNVQTNAGQGFELRAIAAVVIGGTNIMGGSGTVVGTLLGALLIQVLYNACVLYNVSVYWEQFLVGSMILLAVLIDAGLRRREGRGAV